MVQAARRKMAISRARIERSLRLAAIRPTTPLQRRGQGGFQKSRQELPRSGRGRQPASAQYQPEPRARTFRPISRRPRPVHPSSSAMSGDPLESSGRRPRDQGACGWPPRHPSATRQPCASPSPAGRKGCKRRATGKVGTILRFDPTPTVRTTGRTDCDGMLRSVNILRPLRRSSMSATSDHQHQQPASRLRSGREPQPSRASQVATTCERSGREPQPSRAARLPPASRPPSPAAYTLNAACANS
jgi:hypothetical protein